jgi:hypothetical protein
MAGCVRTVISPACSLDDGKFADLLREDGIYSMGPVTISYKRSFQTGSIYKTEIRP